MERELWILKEIVEAHIDSGDAVGSRAVALRMKNAVSAASIRAMMHELGQRGYITQPHTSAGRVPTDLGYRVYLDEMLVPQPARAADRQRIEAIEWPDGMHAADVVRAAARATAEGLGLAAAVVMPRLDTQTLRRLDFVFLRPGRLLAVAVTSSGIVHERLLHVDAMLGRSELERFSNYLNSILPGMSLRVVRQTLERAQSEDRDAVEREALELGKRTFDHVDTPEVVVEGASQVLAQREFAEDPDRGPDLLRTLEQRSVWLGLITKLVSARDVRVYLGAESGQAGFSSCALVATPYGGPSGEGMVVLLGPKRLDYGRVLPFARLLGARLGQVLDAVG